MAIATVRLWRNSALAVVLAGLGLAGAACGSPSGSNNSMAPAPVATVAPTAGPTAVVVTASGLNFSPNSLTIASGTVVTFSSLTGHTVNIDDSVLGSCSNVDLTSFPATHTFTAPSGSDFKIHCDFHSCGATSCPGSCSGMVMNIHIL